MAISRSRRPQESTTCAWRRRVASKGAQMAQLSYPGVYIDEFAPGAPIQGVGTSTAAFIGVAARGTVDRPEKGTSWDQFLPTFGPDPAPGFFLWHAVRGFFANGGQACFVV